MSDRDSARRRQRNLARYHRRVTERRERGLCVKCGKRPPAPERSICVSCGEKARAAERRAEGLCVKCGRAPALPERSQCEPCAAVNAAQRDREAENAARRWRYAERRARGRCVDCDAPSPGAARCEPCALRHREHSGAFRGIPLWDPSWTVIEIATGTCHGTYDSKMEVAACLAFAKLSRDEVEVLADASPMATFTAPPWW